MLVTVAVVKLPISFSSEIPIPEDLDDLDLPSVHPDVEVVDTYEGQFSTDNAREDVARIEAALYSFHELTLKAELALGADAIAKIDNTSLEIQTIAFPNWLNTLTGTLAKQNYQIKKLEYALARKQFNLGEIERTTLESKQAQYIEARSDFQDFWRSLSIVD
ncbi:MAG: hypothetical protein AAFQ41_15650 [Cyanobacteria bacterium J06623_7]